MNDTLKVRDVIHQNVWSIKEECIKVKGLVHHEARHANGEKFIDERIPNTITNAWLAVMSGLVGNTGSQVAFTYLAIGSDNTAASASQTALVSEITTNGWARAAATVSRVTTTQTNDTLQLLKQWSISGALTVEEAGVFNDATTWVMLARQLTGTKVLGNGDTYQITYKIIFS